MAIEIIKSPEYKIRKIREIRNYSQDYLAQNLGLSVRAYSKIETGETQLTIKRLNQISAILDVHPMIILEFNEKLLFDKSPNKRDNVTTLNQFAERPLEYYRNRMDEMEQEIKELKISFQEKMKIA